MTMFRITASDGATTTVAADDVTVTPSGALTGYAGSSGSRRGSGAVCRPSTLTSTWSPPAAPPGWGDLQPERLQRILPAKNP